MPYENASGSINSGARKSAGYFDSLLIRGERLGLYRPASPTATSSAGLAALTEIARQQIENPRGARVRQCFGRRPSRRTPSNIVHLGDPSPVFHWGTKRHASQFVRGVTNSHYVDGSDDDRRTEIPGSTPPSAAGGAFRDGSEQERTRNRPEFSGNVQEPYLHASGVDRGISKQTPDSYGLIYFRWSAVTGVPNPRNISTPLLPSPGTGDNRPPLPINGTSRLFLTIQ